MKNWMGLVLMGFLMACDSANPPKAIASPKEGMDSKNYFEFDEIVHYFTSFEERQMKELFKKASESERDSLRKAVLMGQIPQNTSDFGFIHQLESLGYQKFIVPASKFEAMNQVFREKPQDFGPRLACIHLYRDLLIFKKENQVRGCASLCFSCMGSKIVGARANTVHFGQSSDFEQLRALLK